jgi:hypothetical protein
MCGVLGFEMIPNVYRDNKQFEAGLVPDPKKIREMTQFNEEMGKAVTVLSLNGLHPLNAGTRDSFGQDGRANSVLCPQCLVGTWRGRFLWYCFPCRQSSLHPPPWRSLPKPSPYPPRIAAWERTPRTAIVLAVPRSTSCRVVVRLRVSA